MAVLFTVLLGFSSILIGYFLYDFGKQNFIRETEAAIDIEIEHILAISKDSKASEIVNYISKRSKYGKHPVYLYQNKDGSVLAGNIKAVPDNIEIIKEGVISFLVDLGDMKHLVAAKVHTFSNGSRLLVARDITDIMQSYDRLKLFSVVIISFMLLVILISFFISTFVVTRINKIANTAKEIMDTGDLSRRIEVDSNWDDISYLAKNLNELLTRIESLMEGIRDVSDNIAHDLRTPITRLRGELEGLKNNNLSGEDIDKLVLEVDNILSIFNSLLRIANIEKCKRKQSFKEVDISNILNDVIELYEPLADDKKIGIKKNLEGAFDISGDSDLLFQMFANLIDNAIKFSDKKDSIIITSKNNNDEYEVVIEDSGIGIANDEVEHVFDRFYRVEKSRNTSGSGLGLSMVKAILDLHNAKIKLIDNNPGLKATLSFSLNPYKSYNVQEN
jgi:signal transduction histidine kinase